jgi:hypothetical protein
MEMCHLTETVNGLSTLITIASKTEFKEKCNFKSIFKEASKLKFVKITQYSYTIKMEIVKLFFKILLRFIITYHQKALKY